MKEWIRGRSSCRKPSPSGRTTPLTACRKGFMPSSTVFIRRQSTCGSGGKSKLEEEGVASMSKKLALLSVSDKTGLVEFARGLVEQGFTLISTGGTQRILAEAGLPVQGVAELTGFPEILDGRVKTLHPKIHGGLLARRELEEHRRQLEEHGILPFDVVAVNLYPFAATVAKPGVTLEEAIENIDIGGPTMVRAAAKNYRHVTIVVNPARYPEILQELAENGTVNPETRFHLA